MSITIYHNPRCSKSRASLAILNEHGVEPEVIEYLSNPPTAAELTDLLKALGMKAGELVRRGEQAWTDAALGDDADESTIINAMVAAPILIERPIVRRGDRAVIGRPPENVLELLDR